MPREAARVARRSPWWCKSAPTFWRVCYYIVVALRKIDRSQRVYRSPHLGHYHDGAEKKGDHVGKEARGRSAMEYLENGETRHTNCGVFDVPADRR